MATASVRPQRIYRDCWIVNAPSPRPGFNRWLVPPAALAIHLCIGMAYGFSVFWVPLGRMVAAAHGAAKPMACAGDATSFAGKLAITGQSTLCQRL